MILNLKRTFGSSIGGIGEETEEGYNIKIPNMYKEGKGEEGKDIVLKGVKRIESTSAFEFDRIIFDGQTIEGDKEIKLKSTQTNIYFLLSERAVKKFDDTDKKFTEISKDGTRREGRYRNKGNDFEEYGLITKIDPDGAINKSFNKSDFICSYNLNYDNNFIIIVDSCYYINIQNDSNETTFEINGKESQLSDVKKILCEKGLLDNNVDNKIVKDPSKLSETISSHLEKIKIKEKLYPFKKVEIIKDNDQYEVKIKIDYNHSNGHIITLKGTRYTSKGLLFNKVLLNDKEITQQVRLGFDNGDIIIEGDRIKYVMKIAIHFS